MKKLYYLIILTVILGLVLTGCFLSNVGQVPTTEQSGVSYLTKGGVPPPPSSNLVGLWHFDEGEGLTAYDSSGNDNDGTITGATYDGIANVMFGDALSFDGSNDYVTVESSPSLQLSSKGTIEFWFNPGLGFNGYDAFILKGVAAGTGTYKDLDYGVNRHSDGSIKAWISDHLGINRIYTTIKTWMVGEWYHIAFTWSGDELQIYVNGVSDATPVSQTRNAYVSNNTVTMGRIRGYWYNGLIDEVRIWNTALTAGEIADNYERVYVLIDIKPGSDPNSINLNSKGVIPVAILSTPGFDATTVDWNKVAFGPDEASPAHNLNDTLVLADHKHDVDGDGDLDFVFHFRTQDTGIANGQTSATLTGETDGGIPIVGTDTVKIVGKD